MPSPVIVPQKGWVRKSSKSNKSTPTKAPQLEIGTPRGAFDTSVVRERVRLWQAQGGGVVTAPDIYVEPGGAEREEAKADNATKRRISKTPTKPSSNRPSPYVSNASESDGPRKSRPSAKKTSGREEKSEPRSVSAPRKRIVSDSNWRKQRTPPKDPSSHNKEGPSRTKKSEQDDDIRFRAATNSTPTKPSRRKEKEVSKESTPTYADDGIRVYSTPTHSCRQSEQFVPGQYVSSKSGSVASDVADGNTHLSSVPISTSSQYSGDLAGEESAEPSEFESPKNAHDGKRRNSAKGRMRTTKTTRPSQGDQAEKRESTTGPKARLKRMFSKSEPVPIAPPRVPTIESWLNGTPDPFVDNNQNPFEGKVFPSPCEHDIVSPEELPPSKPSSWRDDHSDSNPGVEVEEALPRSKDSLEVPSKEQKGRERRRRTRDRRQKLDEDDSGAPVKSSQSPTVDARVSPPKQPCRNEAMQPDPPSSPLRRRGAHRHTASLPKKEFGKSSNQEERSFSMSFEEEKCSNISSANSGSSVEPSELNIPPKPRILHSQNQFTSLGRHRLSTIASVETFGKVKEPLLAPTVYDPSEHMEAEKLSTKDHLHSETGHKSELEALERRSSKGRLTRHSDLISVLSVPRMQSKSIKSARSIRTNRSRLATATIEDIMAELTTDESKYMRELRTLVDGVIPVLLSCVLSKSDAAIAAGLFSSRKKTKDDANFTKPIYDMGVALERLKRAHKRIPLNRFESFLTWAHGTQSVYRDYLKAWRSGFQDVVVNLAPADEEKGEAQSEKDSSIGGGLPRNKDGDVVDTNGERVDVAFLLKRPLVRLKYLAKTLKGINFLRPSSEAEKLASGYQVLVEEARKRANEERARLEDEAAANIDATRARDPRTLGPLTGVSIDDTRTVRARDCFNLTFLHTSGQRVDCRVELYLRDNAPGTGSGGDLLICEVDGTGRWLLLPPVLTSRVSARNGDAEGEIVVMIRGFQAAGEEWNELLSLQAEDEDTGFEWVQMLGLTPVPPKLMRMQSFLVRSERRNTITQSAGGAKGAEDKTSPMKSRTPSPHEIEVPIGEHASGFVRSWIERLDPSPKDDPPIPLTPGSTERTRLQKRKPVEASNTGSNPTRKSRIPTGGETPVKEEKGSESPSAEPRRTPRSLNEALELAGSPSVGIRRTHARRHSTHDSASSGLPEHSSSPIEQKAASPLFETTEQKGRASGMKELDPAEPRGPVRHHGSPTGSGPRAKSLIPSLDLPSIPRLRKESTPVTPIHEADEEPQWPSQESSPRKSHKLVKKRPEAEDPPTPPPHQSAEQIQLKGVPTPEFNSSAVSKTKRRPSSPLKHEYEPSTASESSSESDKSTAERNEISSVSDSSDDEDLEGGDVPMPLLPPGALRRLPKVSTPQSSYSVPGGTIAPSQSASQAPYRTVPQQPGKVAKTIASIFYWSDKGGWESLYADECSITVTPGLIEAFEMSSAHSSAEQKDARLTLPSSRSSSADSPQPLIGLELTPLVPIRRGTALDISIRSPPTSDSKLGGIANNNILFRSRSPEECEALYSLINYARINNPTYIALQNARATSFTPQFGGASFNRAAASRGSRPSWFGFAGRGSYRASSAPTPSVARTESSIGSMGSAFSALRRFGQKGSRFSISRSTVTSRQGSGGGSVYTSSDHSSGSGAVTPPTGALGATAAPLGLSNTKIRLYIRETASKWRDMGSARLTIMRPSDAAASAAPKSTTTTAAEAATADLCTEDLPPTSGAPSTTAVSTPPPSVPPAEACAAPGTSYSSPPTRQGGPNDKRVVIVGKKGGETLLDVTLGESCFERVARTGIAVSVWENFGEGVAKEGGVVAGKFKVYMIQMKSEAETAYTFSIVGKLRY